MRINAVCPGTINTPMVSDMVATDALDQTRAVEAIPLGGLGRPDEIGAAALWLKARERALSTAACSSSTAANSPRNPCGSCSKRCHSGSPKSTVLVRSFEAPWMSRARSVCRLRTILGIVGSERVASSSVAGS